MSKRLFVGNLDWGLTSEGLAQAFAMFGAVAEAVVIMDDRNRSKGFGFVTFENDADADKAVAEMNGKELNGRPLTVNEARPRPPRAPRSEY